MTWYNPLTWGEAVISDEAVPETKPDSIRMVVRKESIRAYPDKLRVHLEFYTKPDCIGYSMYVREEPAGEKVLRTFLGKDFDYDEKWTPDAIKQNIQEIFAHTKRDSAAADALELFVETAKGTDHKVLISTDAQDLSATLDVNTKTLETGLDFNTTMKESIDKRQGRIG